MLVGLRDYQDEKADVIMKFTADEVQRFCLPVFAKLFGFCGACVCFMCSALVQSFTPKHLAEPMSERHCP